MDRIYFEAQGEALLERIGMTKAEFARRMGIRKQNVKALFKSKNIETIYKAAGVMGVPFGMLVGYMEEPDLRKIPIVPFEDVGGMFTEDDIPTGDSTEARRRRHKIILSFYHDWKNRNPEAKKYNLNLKDDINIRYVSLEETAGQASMTYLSTLAVLQLDKGFKSMIRMSYNCPGIGFVKMMVGVKQSDKTKVQYCITAIDAVRTQKQEAQ